MQPTNISGLSSEVICFVCPKVKGMPTTKITVKAHVSRKFLGNNEGSAYTCLWSAYVLLARLGLTQRVSFLLSPKFHL